MNILVIIAHPDDEVLGMGGTILKHAKNADKVTVAYMTTGITSRRSSNYQSISSYQTNKKQKSIMKNQIEELRKDAKKSCKLLKVKKTIFFDFPDNELDTVPLLKIIKSIENIIKEIKPDRIYTSHYGDLNIDHRIVFEATLTACRPVKFPVKEIMCFEILSSTDWAFSYEFKPNYFINIKNELDYKIKAMQVYKNEIREFPHPRSIENIKNSAHKWGTVSGLKSAEAFQLIRKFEK
tara:strand:+ start:751 stop:1461 length:711 start_codon:yes stop_codon:yes gene_type:complete